jgi:hypothetical protein
VHHLQAAEGADRGKNCGKPESRLLAVILVLAGLIYPYGLTDWIDGVLQQSIGVAKRTD